MPSEHTKVAYTQFLTERSYTYTVSAAGSFKYCDLIVDTRC